MELHEEMMILHRIPHNSTELVVCYRWVVNYSVIDDSSHGSKRTTVNCYLCVENSSMKGLEVARCTVAHNILFSFFFTNILIYSYLLEYFDAV